MSGRGKFIIAVFMAVVLFSALGLERLFTLRFEKGDVFPPYSSLRSDPLGCKALFMALGRSAGLDARRNYRDLEKLGGVRGATIYCLGMDERLLDVPSNTLAGKLEALAGDGNRMVLAFAAEHEISPAAGEKGDGPDDAAGREKPVGTACPTKSQAGQCGAWGVKIGQFDLPAAPGNGRPRAHPAAPAPELSPGIPLTSRYHFKEYGKGWRPVYCYGERAVVLERRVGNGSIVLLAESYLLSNEALRKDRCAGFLAWLQGAGRTALFDESHLGVSDEPGVMALVKKHRLVPFLMALLALAALYVWKSAVPFAVAPSPENGGTDGGGRDNFSGLVNLLRRNIPPAGLLDACFREWRRSFSRELKGNPGLDGQVRAIVAGEAARPAAKRDPLARYREIARLIEKKRTST